jgi:uncharacterized protein
VTDSRGIFIDTGLFVAIHNVRDADHERAIEIIRDIARGDHGRAITTDYIFDEAVTTALVRTKRLQYATQLGEMILGLTAKRMIGMERVDESIFGTAWALFQRHGESGLSFTDCTSLAAISKYRIGNIASFDSHFAGLVPVIR